MPFSGGHILAGSSSTLDPRIVERDGPETVTGHSYRRYGLPTRAFAKGRRQRTNKASRPGLSINGSFWVYCPVCNTGQAVEPDRIAR